MSLEGEVPDEAGVRVIRRGRATVGGRHYSLIAVATIHVAVGLHVVAAEHVGTCERENVNQYVGAHLKCVRNL